MDFFSLLPQMHMNYAIGLFGALLLLLCMMDFVRGNGSQGFLANNRRDIVKKVMMDILLFLLLTGLLVYELHPLTSTWLLYLALAGLVFSYYLNTGLRQYRVSTRLGIALIHILLGLGVYLLFGMMLMNRLKLFFNLNMTDQFDILYFVYGQERAVVYGFLILLVILYFVIGKLYMKPVFLLYSKVNHRPVRVNIKLSGGELLAGLYVQPSTGRILSVCDHVNPAEATRTYYIKRRSVEYIEVLEQVEEILLH